MRGLLFGVFSFLLICGLLSAYPVAALVGPEPGVSRTGNTSLDDCQKRFTEALRFIEREQDYASEKARYQQAEAKRCSGEKWYDFGLLECVLFVPIFGIVLPFFGLTVIGTLRPVRHAPSVKSNE